ncbi:MAG TPA: ABC transporter ATP-binding protein [Anaerolineaceae bacterium]|nr:ABC transporter ATP-binding protein [Anaerolineaceae bacterium]HPN54040.1 ABC transporter ATP-binding protein [Anaerolineaceae bacterium]
MIEMTDLIKTYRLGSVEVPALRGITLRIEDGESVAIMGKSGSGKSTLMNVIGCLDQPTSGSYVLDGRNIADMNDTDLAMVRNQRIGFVFQQFNLLPRATILRNVEMPMMYAAENRPPLKEIRTRAEEMLKIVGLGDRLNHRPLELSGGQQQRAAIARALINRPGVILADEPTGNLDSKTGAEIMDMLLKLHIDNGLTLVIVTHDPSIAAQMSRVIRLRDGLLENGNG